MSLIDWSEAYSLDNQLIDNQHKKLFGILNKLHDMSPGDPDNRAYTITVERLWSYANYHFIAEEQLMSDVGYGDIHGHLQQHKLFTEKILHLKEMLGQGEQESSHELITFLGNWIQRHVMMEDKKIPTANNLIDPSPVS